MHSPQISIFYFDGQEVCFSRKEPICIENVSLFDTVHPYYLPLKNGKIRLEGLPSDAIVEVISVERLLPFCRKSKEFFYLLIKDTIEHFESENNFDSALKKIDSQVQSYLSECKSPYSLLINALFHLLDDYKFESWITWGRKLAQVISREFCLPYYTASRQISDRSFYDFSNQGTQWLWVILPNSGFL